MPSEWDPDITIRPRGLKEAIAVCDPGSEYAFELIKVSKLRQLNRKRFLRAMYAAALGFLLLFGSQLLRSF